MATLPPAPHANMEIPGDVGGRWLYDLWLYVEHLKGATDSYATTGDWTDVTSSRAFDTDYTNTDTNPRLVSVTFTANSSSGAVALYAGPNTSSYILIDEFGSNYSPDLNTATVSGTIPSGYVYKVTHTSATLTQWSELSYASAATPSGATWGLITGTLSDQSDLQASLNTKATLGANSDITSLTGLTTALAEIYGGTGQNSYAVGDLLYASALNTLSKLTATTDGYVLTLASGVPTWAAPSVTTDDWGSSSGSGFWAATPTTPATAASVGGTGTDQLAIGDGANVNTTASHVHVIGQGQATGASSIAIGIGTASTTYGAKASYAIAIGDRARVDGVGGVAVGRTAWPQGNYSVAIGYGSNPNGTYSLAAGYSATGTTGANYTISLGANAQVAKSFGAMIGAYQSSGNMPVVDYQGEFVNAVGGNFNSGTTKSKNSWARLWTQTTDATATELGTGAVSDTPSSYLALVNNATYWYDVEVVARRTDVSGEYSIWTIVFGIDRQGTAASTALISAATVTQVAANAGNTWSIAVTADTTNGRPAIKVTGEASKTIRWVANCRITTVGN